MSDFRYMLKETIKYLVIGEGDIKNRLMNATINHFIWANVPEAIDVPEYYRNKHKKIMSELTKKQWSDQVENDRIRATIHKSRRKTVAKIALAIWVLYEEFEAYNRNGFLPQ